MKKLFIAFLTVACISISATAQKTSYSFERGYRGNVGLGYEMFALIKNMDGQWLLETNHGFSFGNGLYAGGGLGVMANASANGGIVNLYGDCKYNFLNRLVSPFVDARIGVSTVANTKENQQWAGLMLTPMVGVDIWRFTLGVSYMYFRPKVADSTGVSASYKADQIGIVLYFNW